MACPACGKEASEGDRFCSGCGAPLAATDPPDVVDDLIHDYQKALADRPDDANTLYSLGLALARKGRDGDAVAAWRRVQSIEPKFADVARAIADAQQRIQNRNPRTEE